MMTGLVLSSFWKFLERAKIQQKVQTWLYLWQLLSGQGEPETAVKAINLKV